MRVTTAFNRMLGLPGAWVRDVEFGERAVIVTVALRRKRPICSGCGARGLKIKDHRVKRWRHLDLGGLRCQVECRLRRLYCPGCGDLPEMVEWARAGARYTRDFDDLTAWLAQQMSQTQITRLMRIGWETVGNILARVVTDKLDSGRLDGLRLIGVDEVSYGADHKFLTCVADHDKGSIVWATEGRNAASLQAFFDGLTAEQKTSIKAGCRVEGFRMATDFLAAAGPLWGPDFVVVSVTDGGTQWDLQVYPDADNPQLKAHGLATQYYFQPKAVFIARRIDRPDLYDFGMTLFKGLMTSDRDVGITSADEETGGSWCAFTTTFGVPDGVITSAKQQLQAGNHSPPSSRIAPFFLFGGGGPSSGSFQSRRTT